MLVLESWRICCVFSEDLSVIDGSCGFTSHVYVGFSSAVLIASSSGIHLDPIKVSRRLGFHADLFLCRSKARKFLKIASNWLDALWKECGCALQKQSFPFSLSRTDPRVWGRETAAFVSR